MEVVTKQALRIAENLTLPSVQVVVMKANMSCTHCLQRVSDLISKMNGLLVDYVVDVGKREVTVRGVVELKKRSSRGKCCKGLKERRRFISYFALLIRSSCFTS